MSFPTLRSGKVRVLDTCDNEALRGKVVSVPVNFRLWIEVVTSEGARHAICSVDLEDVNESFEVPPRKGGGE